MSFVGNVKMRENIWENLDSKSFLEFKRLLYVSGRIRPPLFRLSSLSGTPTFLDSLYLERQPIRNIPKFKDRANWSRDTFQPMRRRACVHQQTNQNIAPVIKNFQNNGRSRTESVIVSRLSGIFLRLFMRHTQFFFKWTAYRKPWKCLVKYSAHFVVYFFF